MPDLWYLVAIFAPAVNILVTAGVLRLCGVAKSDVAKWALGQAGRQRFLDLITAARGLPSGKDAWPTVRQGR